jgi:para-nitrobenzyl esterase
MPAARGLFQRAILESGPVGDLPSKEAASQKTRTFLQILGLQTNEIDALWTLPYDKLLVAQEHFIKDLRSGGIQPVLDGKDLVATPGQALARGETGNIALLIGTNRDEARLFTDTITGEKRSSSVTSAALSPELRKNALKILKIYSKSKRVFWRTLLCFILRMPDEKVQDLLLVILTDYVARIPAIRLAEQQARQGRNVWMYRFDWPSPLLKFGACHALELPFVWNKLEAASMDVLLGENPPHELARAMHAAWIAFARSGDPGVPELPPWPAYDLERRATMIFHEVCQVIDDPQADERRVWDDFFVTAKV